LAAYLNTSTGHDDYENGQAVTDYLYGNFNAKEFQDDIGTTAASGQGLLGNAARRGPVGFLRPHRRCRRLTGRIARRFCGGALSVSVISLC
jgi:hypothetical protein